MELGGIGIGVGINKMELTPCLARKVVVFNMFIS